MLVIIKMQFFESNFDKLKQSQFRTKWENSNFNIIEFNNATYFGQVDDNKADGKGIMIFQNMNFYVGDFKNNKFHGEGYYFFLKKGYIFAEFFNGLVHGNMFWVNERMNFSKGEISDQTQEMDLVSGNVKGISNIKIRPGIGSNIVKQMKNEIEKKNLGLLESDMNQKALEDNDNYEENSFNSIPSNYVNNTANNNDDYKIGSKVKFSNKRFHNKKYLKDILTPKSISRFLKTICLISKEKYPGKDTHIKNHDQISELDQFQQAMNKVNNKNEFFINKKIIYQKVVEKSIEKIYNDIGGEYFPWGTFTQGVYSQDRKYFFGRIQYINGDYEWGSFTRKKEMENQKIFELNGFGMRFIREKGLIATGFFVDDRLQKNNLIDFIDKNSFKFSYFINDKIKKDFFFAENKFNNQKIYDHLHIYWINNFKGSFKKIDKDISVNILNEEILQIHNSNDLRHDISMKQQKIIEFKETQVIKYFLDRNLDFNFDKLVVNSRNQSFYYDEMENKLRSEYQSPPFNLIKENEEEEEENEEKEEEEISNQNMISLQNKEEYTEERTENEETIREIYKIEETHQNNLNENEKIILSTPNSKSINKRNYMNSIKEEINVILKISLTGQTIISVTDNPHSLSHKSNSHNNSKAKLKYKNQEIPELQDHGFGLISFKKNTFEKQSENKKNSLKKIMNEDIYKNKIISSKKQLSIEKDQSESLNDQELDKIKLNLKTEQLELNRLNYMKELDSHKSKKKLEEELKDIDFMKDFENGFDFKSNSKNETLKSSHKTLSNKDSLNTKPVKIVMINNIQVKQEIYKYDDDQNNIKKSPVTKPFQSNKKKNSEIDINFDQPPKKPLSIENDFTPNLPYESYNSKNTYNFKKLNYQPTLNESGEDYLNAKGRDSIEENKQSESIKGESKLTEEKRNNGSVSEFSESEEIKQNKKSKISEKQKSEKDSFSLNK